MVYLFKNKKIFHSAIFLFIISHATIVPQVQASGLWKGLEACKADGSCGVNDFIEILVNIATWLLGISGSLALLAFVYGGVLFIVSAGSSDLVAKAKKIIFGAVVGLIIVFVSYGIINFVMTSLGFESGKFGDWQTTEKK